MPKDDEVEEPVRVSPVPVAGRDGGVSVPASPVPVEVDKEQLVGMKGGVTLRKGKDE